jgi:hypothetical protein
MGAKGGRHTVSLKKKRLFKGEEVMADDEKLNTDEKDDDLDVGDQTNDDGEGSKQGGETKTVPLEALEAERKKRQDLEAKVGEMADTLEVYRANLQQARVQAPEQKKVAKALLETLNDDEVVTAKELKQIVAEVTQGFNANVMGPMSELQMMTLYPDYKEVLTNNLQPILKNNPALIEAIKSSSNPNLLAYTLAGGKGVMRGAPKPSADNDGAGKPGTGGDLKKILANAEKPGVPGKGAGAGGKFEKFAGMKDEELEDHIARVKSG